MSYVEKWRSAADDFLAVLLVKPRAWELAIDAGVTSDDLPTGPWRESYRVVTEIRGERINTPGSPSVLNDVEVAARCGAKVTVEWVAERIAMWDEYRELAFENTCTLLLHYGRGTRQLQTLEQGCGEMRVALENATNVDTVAVGVVDGLRAERRQEPEPVDIADITAQNEQRMNEPPTDGIKTGIWLLDEWLRGLSPGEFVGFVSPYKCRKTSILANVLLNMARAGQSLTFFSYDESRARVGYRLEAVLMAEYMWEHKHWNLHAPDGTPLNVVDGKMIRNAGNRWLSWPEPLRLAREYARDTLLSLRGKLRVYDSRSQATTLSGIRAACFTDAMKAGALDFVAVDHIQRLMGLDTIFDKVENGSSGLHHIGGEMGAVMWVLSQQNEAAIRAGNNGDYTPNVKGGGGIASNADTVLMSKYKVGDVMDPNYVQLEVRLAREGEAPQRGYVEIHPASGWITPRRVEASTIKLNAITERVTGKRYDDATPPADLPPLDLGRSRG